MTDLVDEATGLALVVATILFSGLSLFLMRGTGRGGSVMDGLIQVIFLPEKRRKYLWIMSLEGAMFVLGGLLLGVFLLAGLPIDLGLSLFVGIFLAGLGFMSWRTALGLRATALTEEQKEAVRRDLPNSLEGLAFIPLQGESKDDPSPSNLFVVSLNAPPGRSPDTRRSRDRRRGGRPGMEPTGSSSRDRRG